MMVVLVIMMMIGDADGSGDNLVAHYDSDCDDCNEMAVMVMQVRCVKYDQLLIGESGDDGDKDGGGRW